MFENKLMQFGIKHELIKVYSTKHNGKVKRSHRKNNGYFYATHQFFLFDNFAKQ